MVKSKKKLNNRKRHSIKTRKQQYGGQSFTSFGDLRYGADTVSGSLKSIEKLKIQLNKRLSYFCFRGT